MSKGKKKCALVFVVLLKKWSNKLPWRAMSLTGTQTCVYVDQEDNDSMHIL